MNKVSTWVREHLIPDFLLGKEKAIAAFIAPLVVVRVGQWFGWTVDASMVQQLIYSALISLTVHQTTNT